MSTPQTAPNKATAQAAPAPASQAAPANGAAQTPAQTPASTDAATPAPAVKKAEKADKFKRLGNARVKKALAAILSLKSLSNTSQYEYTDAQIATIGKALTDAVIEVGATFAAKGKAAKANLGDLL